MVAYDEYDVIIVGGGPAGLLLARDLAGHFDVLVLERGIIGVTNKNWLTYEDRWRREGFPLSVIENRFTDWRLSMEHRGRHTDLVLRDKYICFDEHRFLRWAADDARKRGATILERTPCSRWHAGKEGVVINGRYSARLMVDCAGISSPVLKRHHLVEMPVYINCYAYIGRFKRVPNRNFYSFRHEGKMESFGFTKIAPRKAQIQYFQYSNKKPDLRTYRKSMAEALRKFRIPAHEVVEWKTATYPTGMLKARSLNRVLLFGDAGFYSPCFNGMGFNEILKQHHRVAKHICRCLDEDLLGAGDLALPPEIADDINNLFFTVLGMTINELPGSIVSRLFEVLSEESPRQAQKVMRNDLDDREIVRLLRRAFARLTLEEKDLLVRSISRKHLLHLLKIFAELNEEVFSEEFHNLVFRHHKIRIKDLYR